MLTRRVRRARVRRVRRVSTGRLCARVMSLLRTDIATPDKRTNIFFERHGRVARVRPLFVRRSTPRPPQRTAPLNAQEGAVSHGPRAGGRALPSCWHASPARPRDSRRPGRGGRSRRVPRDCRPRCSTPSAFAYFIRLPRRRTRDFPTTSQTHLFPLAAG